MGKRMNPFHHAAKEARKSKRAYAERNKKEEDSSSYHLTDYYFERNLRKVHPYYYTFKSFTKRTEMFSFSFFLSYLFYIFFSQKSSNLYFFSRSY